MSLEKEEIIDKPKLNFGLNGGKVGVAKDRTPATSEIERFCSSLKSQPFLDFAKVDWHFRNLKHIKNILVFSLRLKSD